MLFFPPPSLTWILPGPWQDSHPYSIAFLPFACNFACEAVLKSLTSSSWHSAQAFVPEYVAPGIDGGAITVLFTLAQEMMNKENTVNRQAEIAVLKTKGNLQTRSPSRQIVLVLIMFRIELHFKYFQIVQKWQNKICHQLNIFCNEVEIF
jgi:hypothetical protein